MKQRPIIFNTEMVRAILDGRKTQTRRPIKGNPRLDACGNFIVGDRNYGQDLNRRPQAKAFIEFHCPFGKIGDRLWVRETFQFGLCTKSSFAYRASHVPSDLEEGWFETIQWRPSIHMPKWASRILLEVTHIRLERLEDISEEEAVKEGFDNSRTQAALSTGWYEKPRKAFLRTWEKMYSNVNTNPWVWVIEFKVITTTGGAA